MGTPTDGQHEVSAEQAPPRSALERMPRAELFALARRRGIQNTMVMTRDELLEAVALQQAEQAPRNGTPAPAAMAEAAGLRDSEPDHDPRSEGESGLGARQEPTPTPPRPPRAAGSAPLRSPERTKGISVPGVAAAAVATAVVLWRRKR